MKATQGSIYTIVKDDTLSGIALQAYGQASKWRIIWKANKSSLRSGDPNLIYPGEIITIPNDQEEKKQTDKLKELAFKNEGKKEGKATIIVNGNEIKFISAKILRSIDTVSYFCSFVIDAEQNEEIGMTPFGFDTVEAYIDNKRKFNGFQYKLSTGISDNSAIINVEAYTGSVDIVDSTCKPPYQFKNRNLKQVSDELCSQFGFTVVDKTNDTYKFKKANIEKTQKVFEFLKELATQRSSLFSFDDDDNLIIYKVDTNSIPIGTIEENDLFSDKIECSFDSRKRFSDHRSCGSGPSKNINSEEKDIEIKRTRIKTYQADETTKDKIKDHTKSQLNRSIGNSISIPYTFTGFYTNEEKLIDIGNIITIKNTKLFLKEGTKFLIKQVEYNISDQNCSTDVELVLPSVYTDEKVESPWKAVL